MKSYEVIIVGAGVSGLMAAAELSAQKKSVLVLEARERVGGRIHTAAIKRGMSIELGAEFIHELSADIRSLLEDTETSILEADGEHLYRKGRELRPLFEVFDGIDSELSKIPVPRRDVPIAELLPRKNSLASELTFKFVEGFNAAPASRMSARALLKSHKEAMAKGGYTSFRPLGGYRQIVDGLLARIDPRYVDIRSSAIVKAVNWNSSSVGIKLRDGRSFKSKKLIVTVPPSILARGIIQFAPSLNASIEAAKNIGMGTAARAVLELNKGLENFDSKFENAYFVHSPDRLFPTWWTSRPFRAPFITAWSGGPKAESLAKLTKEKLRGELVASLAGVLGVPERSAQKIIKKVYYHNWTSDPYALGAYSYIKVGQEDAPKRLARPVKKTIFFAGEAVSTQTIGGTVGSAIDSGKRATRLVLRAL